MFERLFPDQRKFFAEFGRIAGKLTDAASLLERGFEEPARWPELVAPIHQIQRAVDVEAHALTARRAVSLRANQRREPAIRLAHTLVLAVSEIQQAIADIRSAELVLAHSQAAKHRKEAGEAISRDAISALFLGKPNPLDVIRWKTLYEQLEEALEACEDVANELETITLKHTVS